MYEQSLSDEVRNDIKAFILLSIDEFRKDAVEYAGLDITFATNDKGDQWNYQTGDNSYTGGCYSLPHWAIATIYEETDPLELYEDITSQLVDLLPDNR